VKNVSKKLLQAIAEVGGKVQKTGWNSYSKYHYITESDINEAVLPALTKAGLILTTSVISVKETPSNDGQKNRFAEVLLSHKIIDTDSGECLEFQSAGTGADTLDKSVYKALTGSCKYFLLKLFMISGDMTDPENDGVSTPSQVNKGATKQAPQQAAPVIKQQGFFGKKTEPARQAAEPPKTEAKKPTFAPKKAPPPEVQEPEVESNSNSDEEDPQF